MRHFALVLLSLGSLTAGSAFAQAIPSQPSAAGDPVLLAADPQLQPSRPSPSPLQTEAPATSAASAPVAQPSTVRPAGAVAASRSTARPAAAVPPTRSAVAGNPERKVWDRTPIRVQLTVGQERLVILPLPMRLGLPASLGESGALRSQVLGRTAYLTAHAPFDPVRVVAESAETGQAILLDIGASARADGSGARPLEVLFPAAPTPAELAADSAALSAPEPLDPVVLTRFAARQVYAPRRLALAVEGVSQVALDRLPRPHLYRGARVTAEPLASWRGADLYVTAVRLVNRESTTLELDPRNVEGRWMTVTFQAVVLGPAGSEREATAVYLVSEQPFAESL